MPKVSIIMPVYNAGIFLKDAISDILHQTLRDFELICVNDGSTDDSKEVLEFFSERDSRIHIISQLNKGAGEARNVGFKIATGEYVLFLDADDRFDKNLLQEAVEKADDTHTDIVVVDADCFDSATGVIAKTYWILRMDLLGDKRTVSLNDCPDLIFNVTTSGPLNKMFRTEFVRQNNISFMNTPYMNDSYFVLLALSKARRIDIIDKNLVYYRTNAKTSITSSAKRVKNPNCPVEVLKAIKEELEKNGIYERVWKSFANYAIQHLFWIEDTLEIDAYVSYFNWVKQELFDYFRISELSKDDFWDEMYRERVSYLQEHGPLGVMYIIKNQLKDERVRLLRDRNQLKSQVASQEEICLRFAGIPDGATIVIYGAGYRGKRIYEDISRTGRYKVTLWVDKNFESIEECKGLVSSPEYISQVEYDYLVIAIDDIKVVKSVINELENKVDRDKIIW